METASNAYTVLTDAPDKVPSGFQCITFNRKSTAKNPVEESDKSRSVIVPAFPTIRAYNVDAGDDCEPQQVWKDAIMALLTDHAKSIFLAWFVENQNATTIPTDLLSFEAVVNAMQQAATSQRLNGDMIAEWYDASKTAADALARYTAQDSKSAEEKAAKLRKVFCSLATNNPGIPQTLAVKMISYVNPADTENELCKRILQKLEVLSRDKVNADDL